MPMTLYAPDLVPLKSIRIQWVRFVRINAIEDSVQSPGYSATRRDGAIQARNRCDAAIRFAAGQNVPPLRSNVRVSSILDALLTLMTPQADAMALMLTIS